MNDSKSLFASMTFWGVLVTLVSPILKSHGIEVDAAGLANDIATGVGAAVAIYGRIRASQKVHVLPQ